MDNEQLEEVSATPAAEEQVRYEEPAPPPPAGTKGFPQLHKFMWGAIIVLVGTLLPFGPAIVNEMYGDLLESGNADSAAADEMRNRLNQLSETLGSGAPAAVAEEMAVRPSLPAVHGFETFTGAIFLVIALLLIGQMRAAIAERRVKLGAVLLMLFPAVWTWLKFIQTTGELEWFGWGETYKWVVWERLALDIGSGFLLVLIGSTYVTLVFLKTFVKALTGGGKKPVAAPAATGGTSRGRTRRR